MTEWIKDSKEIPAESLVKLNGRGDLYMLSEVRAFFKKKLKVVRRCKSGLYQVCMLEDPKNVISVPKRNIDPWSEDKEKIDISTKSPIIVEIFHKPVSFYFCQWYRV